jgi:MYXO-CTERM domain-containing protein
MSLNSKRTRPLVGILAGLGLVAVSGLAEAATVQLSTGVLLVKQSSNAKVSRGTGAGILMPRLAPIGGNKLMAIWMDSAPDSIVPQSDSNDNNGYWEGKVSVIQLNAEAAPTIVNTQQFTSFTGDRPFNHPRHAAGGSGDYVIIAFASSMEDPDITNEYVMALDATGAVLSLTGKSLNGDNQVTDSNGKAQPVLNIGQNDGDNHGASDILFSGTDSSGVDHFLGTYQHNNNDIYAYGLAVTRTANGGVNVVESWKNKIVTPANIGRGTCALTGTTTATCCSAKGNNRPPEVGIECVALDTTTGIVSNKSIVAASNPEQKVYMNQPSLTFLGNGTCALGYQMSDGTGRSQNGHFLSANTSQAATIDCTTLTVKNTQQAIAPFQRHATMSSSVFGNQGQMFISSLGCSSTGAGGAGLQLVSVDSNGMMTVDKENNMLPVMWQCDTAWLSYKGLRNPNNQGRDFLHSVGGIVNPGYGDPKGWMPEVSNFDIALIPAVHDSTATRNSLYMSIIPIAWDKSVQVSMGAAVDVSQIPTGPSPQVDAPGAPVVGNGDPNVNGSQPGSGTGTGTGTSGGNTVHHSGFLGMDDSGGCSVSAVGASPEDGLEGLALVGLGLAVAASRRRRV